ncbi:RDD family protein [Streptomyces sp. PTM05]|uniref:RDD family protein n=1 Tax=Streptantibioticus parmotrematis TaxID=2873249 RepID=A0ABS7QXP3_9ACTN|nr:RDD family protein [Streptantibioticus parmotrematis]MBY8887981.1 RDD family protein [Streptantibioticus parmotrematis]
MSTSGGGAESPREGYYPDPSIPGYVRYWNGSAWVPGTSRPQPAPGEVLTPPPAAVSAASSAPGPAPVPVRPPASVEESGPMFLDEDPAAPVAQRGERAAGESGWKADPARQSGVGEDARRVAWGSEDAKEAGGGGSPEAGAETPAGTASAPPASASAAPASAPAASGPRPASALPAGSAPPLALPAPAAPSSGAASVAPASGAGVAREGGYGYPRTAPPAAPAGGYGYPQGNAPAAPGSYGYPQPQSASGDAAVPWQRQVQRLATPAQDAAGEAAEAHPVPWRPPAAPSNPFLAAQEPDRPASPGRRLLAGIVDTVVLGAVVGAATFPLVTASVQHLQHKIDAARLSGENVQIWLIDGTTGLCLGTVLAVLLVAGLLYEALPTARWGRTLGKKLLGVRVLDIESQLTPGFGRSLRRTLVRLVLHLLVIGVVNDVWCLFDRPWRQCWHDKAARTFVAAGK